MAESQHVTNDSGATAAARPSEALLWGAVLLLAGVPVYLWMRRPAHS